MRQAIALPMASMFLMSCASNVEHAYPVPSSQARISGDIYKTIADSRGSVVDNLPNSRVIGSEDSRVAGKRVGWQILGEAAEGEDTATHRAEWNDAILTLPPSERPAGRRLWEAALASVSTIALQRTDPKRGLIVSEWLISPQRPDERVRTTIYVLGEAPVPGSIRVVFDHQRRDSEGEWAYAPASPQGMAKLENRILNDARRLR